MAVGVIVAWPYEIRLSERERIGYHGVPRESMQRCDFTGSPTIGWSI